MTKSAPIILDPDAQRLLTLIEEAGYPPLHALTPADARTAYARSWAAMQSPGGEVSSVSDVEIDGPGGKLALRIYRGLGTDPKIPLPCLVYLHGGGWVIGNLESHDRLCRRLATVARICVVAVDYRLAPEHPFPAPLDDAASALRWVAANAERLSIHPAAIGVGGDSAGGNLAAALALMARDGTLPPLAYQALLYPVLDLAAEGESYRRVTSGFPLTDETMRYFIGHYTPDAASRKDWRASPLLAPSVAGTPPALMLTMMHDPLCDEGLAYARRLEAAGVRVTSLHLNDQMHGLLGQGRLVPAANIIGDFVYATIGQELHRAAAQELGDRIT